MTLLSTLKRRLRAAAPVMLLCAMFALTVGAKPARARTTDDRVAEQLERDLERKWGKRRAVKVVVNRLYPKAKRFEIDLFAGVVPNDAFQVYLTPGLRLAWHFNERWALELSGAYTHGFDTGLRKQLEDDDALIQARARDNERARFGLAVMWSPIYGKFAFHNRKVGHFDLYFIAEVGGVYVTGEESLGLRSMPWPEVGLGIGMRFYLSRLLSLRVAFRQRFSVREGVGDDSIRFAFPSELSVGLSFLLGGKRRRKK